MAWRRSEHPALPTSDATACRPVLSLHAAKLHLRIQNLRRTRDLLLPRLLSEHISLTTKDNYANA